ncbi:DNA topoisomerase 2 [Mycoemilia scoparia]|uniref:DNA topoisomerase 2 n=1 Tax=Mycoemilia scoparia TaxID=417184 RepID=A0A9W8DQE6_9FUNG|nr:DNA topoisomerase 2 [Mycoemilia scoparia]
MSDSESQFSLSPDEDDEFVMTPIKAPKATVGRKRTLKKATNGGLDEDDSMVDSGIGDSSPPKKRKTTGASSNGKGKKNIQTTLNGVIEPAETENSGISTPTSVASKGSKAKRTVEEIYQKKSQLEHILLRPDTYIGTVEPITETMWVYSEETQRMAQEAVTYTPGLYKIVDEILVNAADNKQRDPTQTIIKVTVNLEENEISVYNNGKGIPVQMHAKEKLWVPELIFGHLLTSSNYDDDEKKVTGGRNGYGAKLCNIFSTEFIVETADATQGKKYKQVFKNNMSIIGKPSITKFSSKSEWTKITFKPDFKKFHMDKLDHGIYKLIQRRVYDLAGCVRGCKVYFNDERIPINNFQSYVEKYVMPPAVKKEEDGGDNGDPENAPPKVIYKKFNDFWEVAFVVSDGQFQQVSFVNSINTVKGGNHVTHVANQISEKVIEAITKKNKKAKPRPHQVKSYMWLFVNSLIVNPAFDSQTKETLTLRQSAFGSKCEIDDAFIKKILNTNLSEYVMSFVRFKEEQQLKKTDGSKNNRVNVPKLEDANYAGGKKSSQCTLILTEGDSAKSLAVAGLSVVGRSTFGVFPLRGKLLNVRDATMKAIGDNKEFTYLKQILGLKQGKKYLDTSELRYGKVMIMTDQDIDGSHIKGLILNLFDTFYPELLKIPGFLQQFITPVLVAKRRKEKIQFFSEIEYNQWRERQPNNAADWTIKYYKGLGTSSTSEGREYFRNIPLHKKEFSVISPSDRELIDLAFNKKKADDRKEWLRTYQPGTFVDNTVSIVPIDDFINKELITFSIADNARSIPSVVDGFKPAQRKVLYGCFAKKLTGEIKVSSLAGYVMDKLSYHHGETSLQATIVNLAQDFVGSNNINTLGPNGQLGTRLMGGKDAASPRYIYVHLPKMSRAVFHKDDSELLTYLEDEGKVVEPYYFVPVVPMVLINGAEGIGTGWSTSIPNYNPVDIVDNIRRMMRGEEPLPMDPWFRGFQGTVEKVSTDRYRVSGTIAKIDDETLHITELPVRMWTDNYIELLNQWRSRGEKSSPIIKDFVDNHTHSLIDFQLKLTPEQMRDAEKEGFEKRFKLTSVIATSNMVCFDREGRLRKYENAQEIIKEFYPLRLQYYQKRKELLANKLQREYTMLDNKARFVLEIIEKKLIVQNRKKAVIIKDLRDKGYAPFPKGLKPGGTVEVEGEDASEVPDPERHADLVQKVKKELNQGDKDFDYLLSMPIWNLTYEKFQDLLRQRDDQENLLKTLLAKAPTDLWNEDLDEFLQKWDEHLAYHDNILEEERAEHEAAQGKTKKKTVTRKRNPATSTSKAAAKIEETDPDSPIAGAKKKPRSTAKKVKTETSIVASKTNDAKPAVQSTLSAFTTKGKAAAADISLYDSSDSDNEPVLNFRERLEKIRGEKKASTNVTKPVDKAESVASSTTSKKRSVSVSKAASSTSSKAAGKKKAANKILESDSEDDDLDLPELPEATKTSRPARSSARSAASNMAKKSQYLDISDDEDDGDDDGGYMEIEDDDDDDDGYSE